MDKTLIRQAILARLTTDRQIAADALRASHEAATHSESKAENKYDTRGLEAAYLADGQRRRLHEIDLALAAYRNLPISSSDHVRVGSLVRLADERTERWLFLGPEGAGLKVQVEGVEMLVISPRSPLGQALLGRGVDDEVAVTVEGQVRHYDVIAVH